MMSTTEAAVRQAADALAAALLDAIREQARPADPPERLLSMAEAAHVAGLGRSALYSLISRGELRTLKVGRRRLVPASALAELAARAARADR